MELLVVVVVGRSGLSSRRKYIVQMFKLDMPDSQGEENKALLNNTQRRSGAGQ